jgi:hypothetical protein
MKQKAEERGIYWVLLRGDNLQRGRMAEYKNAL